MTVQVTIIGLRQIGTSIGLALGEYKDQIVRTGTDADPARVQQAQKQGALDKISYRLADAVRDADVVLLAVPIEDVEETLKAIAPELRAGAVILDTSPLKVAVFEWVKDILPEDRYFISFLPTLNPVYLHEVEAERGEAHLDLFKNGLVVIACPPGTHADAVRLADDLTGLIGARPFYADPYESDGLVAAIDLLPQLTSSALLTAISSQPGWQEARKLGGKAFMAGTSAMEMAQGDNPETVFFLNRENTIRVLDNLIHALGSIRDTLVDNDSETLHSLLLKMRDIRHDWWTLRQQGNWERKTEQTEIPSAAERLGRLIGLRPRKGKK